MFHVLIHVSNHDKLLHKMTKQEVDVVLIDDSLLQPGSYHDIEEIKRLQASIKVVAMGFERNTEILRRFSTLGVDAYISLYHIFSRFPKILLGIASGKINFEESLKIIATDAVQTPPETIPDLSGREVLLVFTVVLAIMAFLQLMFK